MELKFSYIAGCTVLDVDPGKSTNRTVYTFVGDKKSVVEGALNACRVAYELIDMTKQTGAHPRMGACDVCPFIPISVRFTFSPSFVGSDHGRLCGMRP